jgi:hypothetical protein
MTGLTVVAVGKFADLTVEDEGESYVTAKEIVALTEAIVITASFQFPTPSATFAKSEDIEAHFVTEHAV